MANKKLPRLRKKRGGKSAFVDAFNALAEAVEKFMGTGIAGESPIEVVRTENGFAIRLAYPPDPYVTFKLRTNKPQGSRVSGSVKGAMLFTDFIIGDQMTEVVGEDERDIYFRYAPGGYIEKQWVRCQWIGGRYEVMSPGLHFLTGTLSENLRNLGTATLQVGIYGETIEVTVYGLFFEENAHEVIGADWCDNLQLWLATARICENTPSNDDIPPPEGCDEFGYCRYLYTGGGWSRIGYHCTAGGTCPLVPDNPPPDPEEFDIFDECCIEDAMMAPMARTGAVRGKFGIHHRGGVVLSIRTQSGRRIGKWLEGKPFPNQKRRADLEAFSRRLLSESEEPTETLNGPSES